MQLGLRTKLTLVMTGLVFLVVVVLSAIFVARLTSQVIHDTNTRANELAQQMFEQAKHALEDAKEAGERPNSNSPEDRHAYVKRAFQTSDGLMAALQSPLGSNPWIYDVSIVVSEYRFRYCAMPIPPVCAPRERSRWSRCWCQQDSRWW